MTKWTLGFIGGSGLYQVPGIECGRWETLTPPPVTMRKWF